LNGKINKYQVQGRKNHLIRNADPGETSAEAYQGGVNTIGVATLRLFDTGILRSRAWGVVRA